MYVSDLASVIIVGLLFTLVASLFVNWMHGKHLPRRAVEVVTGTAKAVTEPFVRGGKHNSSSVTSRATLLLIDSNNIPGIPHNIPLDRGRVTIGRDPEMVNVPISERRVSRYHCRINEEGGQFRLWDEGSTSGTYVNDEEVGHTGRILMHGDTIEIGPVKYQFVQLDLDIVQNHTMTSVGTESSV